MLNKLQLFITEQELVQPGEEETADPAVCRPF